MNKEKLFGQIRELLSAGGLLVFGTQEGLPAWVGLIVSIVAIVYAVYHHEGKEAIFTSVRKFLGAIPAILLSLGYIDPEKAVSLTAFIPLLVALIWSFVSNGGTLPPVSGKVGAFLMVMLAIGSLGMTSCASPNGSSPTIQDINLFSELAKQVILNYK